MSPRWPIHPAPHPGEAMTSWLGRIALVYHLSVNELLDHAVPRPPHGWGDLDMDVPASLLRALAQRTGVSTDRLAQMSIGGWAPWLLDSLEEGDFGVYVHQFSLLLPPGRRRRPGRPWRAWLGQPMTQRACRRCAEQPGGIYRVLLYALPLMSTCPHHGTALSPCFHLPDQILFYDAPPEMDQAPDTALVAMDRLTHQALTHGRVSLAGRQIHAGVWLRALRALIDEVSLPASTWPAARADLHAVWEASGQQPRAGLGNWRAYEEMAWPAQARVLRAAASAIDLLATGQLRGRGSDADLLTPASDVELDDGRAATAALLAPVSAWAVLMEEMRTCTERAITDPLAARALVDGLCMGSSDPTLRARVVTDLIHAGVPAAHLSHDDDRVAVDAR